MKGQAMKSELLRHVERKRALRLAIEALPEAWSRYDPGAALSICDRIGAALLEPEARGTTGLCSGGQGSR
jgi:hypothetical protein